MMKKFDVLGKKISFYYDNEETITSGFGGAISSFMIIVLALLIASFGQDFFKRTNPSMVSSVKSPLDYSKFYINNKNFSLAFQLGEYYPHKNTTLFYPTIEYSYLEITKSGYTQKIVELETHPCTKEDFFDNSVFAERSTYLDALHCPTLNNLTVGGYIDGGWVGKLEIKVTRCMEGKADLDGNPCEKESITDKILSNKLYFFIFYQNTLIDANNYEEGLIKDIESTYYTLDKVLYKNPYYFFQNITLETDFGWLMKQKEIKSYLGFKTKYMDMNSFETLEQGSSSGVLTRAVIYFSKDTQNYYREYVKIQTLAAQVGGIIKIFMLIGSVFVDRYNLFKAKFELGSLLMFNKTSSFLNNSNSESNINMDFKIKHDIMNNSSKHVIKLEKNALNNNIDDYSKNNIFNKKYNSNNIISHQKISKFSSNNIKNNSISNIINNNNISNVNLIKQLSNSSSNSENKISKCNSNNFESNNIHLRNEFITDNKLRGDKNTNINDKFIRDREEKEVSYISINSTTTISITILSQVCLLQKFQRNCRI